eukprot:GDKJ01024268.1.p1 GENE.GDKJ01024268.1~~GDKJ01024268.1.p1  ORF type:complete len:375 (+),score=74.55 GDKJ01024268.1:90-1127(+)
MNSTALNITEKSDAFDEASGNFVGDFQTEADRRTEMFIKQNILEQFPKIRIVGEESIDGNLSNEHVDGDVPSIPVDLIDEMVPVELSNLNLDEICIYIDPLDGTNGFTKGTYGDVTTLVGVSYKSSPLIGIVLEPLGSSDRLGYAAVVGGPVMELWSVNPLENGKYSAKDVRGEVLQFASTRKDLNSVPRAVVFTNTRLTPYMTRVMNKIDGMIADIDPDAKPVERLPTGGAGRKYLDVLLGKAEVFFNPRPGTKRWDSCAPEALLLAAGYSVTDSLGDSIKYGGAEGDEKHPDVLNVFGITASCGSVEWHLKWVLQPQWEEAKDTVANRKDEAKWFEGWDKRLV